MCEVTVFGHVALDHTQSTQQLAQASSVSRSSIIRILKAHTFHPYRVTLAQELNEDDPDRRFQFYEEISQRLIEDPDFII